MFFRNGTNDSIIYQSIVQNNEYRLPGELSREDIVVDIGAHIGAFTYAVLERGAGQAYAVEADPDNYALAARNLSVYVETGRATVIWGAAWRSGAGEEVLYHGGYSVEHGLVNTGGGAVLWQNGGRKVPAVPFDDIVMRASENGKSRIRMLKLDCEGSEWPILLTSSRLDLIDEICGEYHEIGGQYDTHSSPFHFLPRRSFTIEYLSQFLEGIGFGVSSYRHRKPDGHLCNLGMFFAARTA